MCLITLYYYRIMLYIHYHTFDSFITIQRKGKAPTEHYPEVILNNFTTRLGHSIGRLFAALFPQDPQFVGRQVATFHNQRDFIFFRFHRYRNLLMLSNCVYECAIYVSLWRLFILKRRIKMHWPCMISFHCYFTVDLLRYSVIPVLDGVWPHINYITCPPWHRRFAFL